jgi:two-component system response regulator LytT
MYCRSNIHLPVGRAPKHGLVLLINQFQQSVVTGMSFISYRNDKMIPLSCENICCFYTKKNLVFAITEKAEYAIDECMDDVEKRLPNNIFYRANRQFIVQRKFIDNAKNYSNSRLLLTLSVKTPEEIIISREKVSQFKKWITGQ